MINKIPIRMRLTAISVFLLTICCVGLTIILSFSANRMADVIEATPISPAFTIGEDFVSPPVQLAPATPSKESQMARDQFQYQSILYMALVIIVGGGLTYYMTGKALKPLQELSSQMKNRTVHNLSEELEVPQSHDELADLTLSFNQMSQKLDKAFAMQKRFSQSAAHELRTPLTVLKTKVDVFKKKEEHSPEEYNKLLAVISSHTDRLADLVTDLLGLANMDALECEEEIQLQPLLSQVVKELIPLADEKNITITLEGFSKIIIGNKSLLHRGFYNLVENAIKYNVTNGNINIVIERFNQQDLITVSDTGIGIPDELQNLIFEPFYRVDKSRSRQMGGAGLGLAITKTIIEKHNGSITVLSNQKGGTDFQVLL